MIAILSAIDRARIVETTFTWCLHIERPPNIYCPLLKEIVNQWVWVNESIRVRQRIVPFTIFDVCMFLGLGLDGL